MKKIAALSFLMAFVCLQSHAQQFTENFETAPFQFSVITGFTATQNTTYYQEGTSSLHFTTTSVNTQGTLTMNNSIDLTKLSSPKFSFYHICATEPSADFGHVQYSNNGGAWTSFPTSAYKGQGILKNGVVGFDATSYTDWEAQFKDIASTPGSGTGGAFWKQEIIDLSAFKSSPNFKIRFVYSTNAANNYFGWLIDRVAVLSATALSGIYTINNTSSTSGTNYTNFRDAITDLNIKGTSSPVTFSVNSGQTFQEDAPAIFASGTTTDAIQFVKSGSGNNPVIKPTGGASPIDAGITISGGDYIIFDGVDITEALGSAVEYGYYIVSASKTNGAQNNTIKNTSISLNKTNTSSFGIYQSAKYDPTHVNTDANNYNKYYNLTIKNVYGGIYLLGYNASNYDIGCEVGNMLSSSSFNSIGDSKTANDIGGSGTGAYGVGIRIKNQNSIKVYNNEVSNVFTSGSDSKAIGIFLENSSGSSFVYNNKVHDITTTSKATSLPPIVTGIRADVSTNATATLYNNFVYSLTHSIGGSTATATPVIQGIAANVGSTRGIVNIYHNSANIAASNTNATCTAFYTSSGTAVVKNNVFSNTGTSSLSTAKQYAIYYNSGTLTSDYNDLYVATGNNNFIGYYNAEQSTLANWKSATGNDASSRNENPPFVSPTDLHIPAGTSTELESSGTPVSVTNVTTDIDGQTRPGPAGSVNGGGNAPDMGADEFDGKPVPLMTYSSSEATQTTAKTCVGAPNVQIISMQVATANTALPLSLTNLVINSNGTTSLSNTVASFQLYYTGNSNAFGTSNPVNNATVLSPGNNMVTPLSTLTLSTGVNYFWLVYNLKTTASGSLDAQFNSITVTSGSTSFTYTPVTTDPAGSVLVYIPPVTINPAAAAICFGTPVTLTASGADTYVWTPVTDLSATKGSTVIATPSATSTYTVTGTDAVTGCTATGTSAITVTPLSTAAFTSSSFTTCVNQNVVLGLTGTPNTSVDYQINGNGNYLASLSADGTGSITTNNLQSGTNTYALQTVSASSGTCATNISSKATVNAQSLPLVQAIVVPDEGAYVQTGATLQLSDATSGGSWSSSTIAQATIDQSTGLVTAAAQGSTLSGPTTITYIVTDNTSLHCQNSATATVQVYNPDYVTKSAIVYFSDNNWQINRGDNTYVNAPSAPSATNTGYTSITIQNPLNMDVDFQLPSNKTFTIATGGTMTILPNKTFSSQGTVAFNGNAVTVKSDATGTGAIGVIATAITGASNVTAERYLPQTTTNTSGSRTGRAWRLLTAPVTGQTVNGTWQENAVSANNPANPNPGYGTLITGAAQGNATTAAGHGFDFWPAITGNTTSSIRHYDPAPANGGTNWPSYTDISTLHVNDQPAYMLFVRGDRTVQTYGYPSSFTTLRAKGTLNQTSKTYTVSGSNTYTLVGNPFASTIDFDKVYTASGGSILQQFSVWNSQNGSYGAYSLVQGDGNGNYTITPNNFTGNNSNPQYIASGEGFFVQPSSGAGGNITINETAKVLASAPIISTFDVRASTDAKLYVNLNLVSASDTTLADGVMARFDAGFSAAIDGDDAQKQTNFNENLGIERNNTQLIVESRPDVQKTDTVQLKLWNVSARAYQLQLKGDNFAQAGQGLHAYLEDSYLKTRQEVSLSGSISTIAFAVTSDTASYDSHRFRVVFQAEASVLPITLTSVKAQLQNSGVSVSWSTQNEVNVKGYVVERSVDGGSTFTGIATAAAKNNGATTPLASYTSFDAAPKKGDNYYRIRIEGADGKVTYSGVAKVTVGEDAGGKTLITLYPNPVSRREGKATLSLKNVKEGDYLLSVYSESGQNIVEKKITVASGSRAQNESVPLPQSLAQGSYQLQLTDLNGNKVFTQKLGMKR